VRGLLRASRKPPYAPGRLSKIRQRPLMPLATILLEFPAMKDEHCCNRFSSQLASNRRLGRRTTEGGPSTTTVYELRVYHTYPGKLDDLLKRFREHTTKLFEKHGMKNVAYWTPLDEPAKSTTLIYVPRASEP